MENESGRIEVLMLTRESSEVSPEERITRLFAQAMSMCLELEVASCSENLLDESDNLVGQFPILLYKHWVVPRKYIWHFWSTISNIDSSLTPKETELTHSMSELITHRLRTLLVSRCQDLTYTAVVCRGRLGWTRGTETTVG